MANIAISNLTKSFGALTVLHDLNLSIEEGEFVALVGPSGCGKSTLLRILAGLDEPSSGTIEMAGAIVNELTPKERNVAMVFQSYALYPHMTAGQNIGFNLRISGKSKGEIAKAVARAAEILDLTPLLDRKPSQLSGGQRQRVAMGRALVRDPDAFLFDEPLSNLDAKLRVQMRDEIKALHSKVRTTSVYVTHDQIEAMTLADRIVIMDGGKIQQVGTPHELYKYPVNKFVAGFIGSPSMNFVTGVKSGDSVLLDGQTSLELPAQHAAADGPVDVGLRPEDLKICDPAHASITGTVLSVEPTGAQNFLRVKLGGVTVIVIDNDLHEFQKDATVGLNILAERIHIFPSDGPSMRE